MNQQFLKLNSGFQITLVSRFLPQANLLSCLYLVQGTFTVKEFSVGDIVDHAQILINIWSVCGRGKQIIVFLQESSSTLKN